MNLDQLIDLVNEFRDEREWRKFHNPKDLAISISLEAAELLENFQWIDSESALNGRRENVEQEIADVLIYCLMLSSDLDLDPSEIIRNKIELNQEKYPVEKAKGSARKYTEF